MLRPLRCVRFGEVLLDENLRTFLLCTSCQSEYASLQQFGAHFKSSACGSAFFQDSASKVKWPTDNVTHYKRHSKGQQQYLVYNVKELTIKTSPTTKLISASAAATTTTQTPTAPQTCKTEKDDDYLDLLKIEEELLDPRWYTDLEPVVDAASSASAAPNSNQILAYNELVEAVTPYVQFKENLHKYASKSTKMKKVQVPATKTIVVKEKVGHNQPPIESNRDGQAAAVNRKSVVGTRVLHPTAKRCLAIEMQETDSVTSSAPAVKEQQKRQPAAVPTNKQYIVQVIDGNSQQSTPTTSPAIKRRKTTIIPLEQFQNQLVDKKETNIPKTLPQSKKIQTIAQVAKAKEEQQTRPQPQPQKQPMLLGSKTAAPPAASVKPSIQQTNANVDSARTETATGSSRAPPSVKQTEQILTKLQTLGLQVKRTQPASGSSSAPPSTKIDETLELLKKLQSKGMKVKVLNKEMAAGANTPKKKLSKPTAVGDSQVAMTVKTKTAGLSRSLIIKKVK